MTLSSENITMTGPSSYYERSAHQSLLGVLIATALAWCLLTQIANAAPEAAPGLGISRIPSKTKPYTPCPPGGRMIECNIVIDPPATKTQSGHYRLSQSTPLLEGSGEEGGFDPKDLQSAYQIPATGGSTSTVAIIDAYGYASAESDLAKYRERYGLSVCTKASGCFKKVNQKGEEKNYPKEGGGLEVEWSLETALDMDMVSTACPGCKILLVEATTQGPADTAASVEEAAKLGATSISNSYGYAENSEIWCPSKKGCAEYLSAYHQAGIPVTVSSGDSGYDDSVGAPSWPATSPNVIAVGGTTLTRAANARGWSESTWKLSGSGCSLYEVKPTWQTDTGCAKRTDNDVAVIADNETPVSIYNASYGGWVNVGGTSVGAPLIAGIEAHAEKVIRAQGARIFYERPGGLFDVTTGSNGSCGGSYLCTAGTGYDGPTGNGSPNGIPQIVSVAAETSPAVARDPVTKDQLVSYVDGNGEIAVWGYSEKTGWINEVVGGKVRSGTSPTATVDSSGEQAIYYVNTAGEIAAWGYSAKTGWINEVVGGKVLSGTSPSAVTTASDIEVVYYVNTSGEIALWAYSKKAGWINEVLGGKVRSATSPAATVNPSSKEGEQGVYYVNTSGEIAVWGLVGEKWGNSSIGGSARTGTSPAVARDFKTGEGLVYYVSTGGEIGYRYYEGGWKGVLLTGVEAKTGTSPAVEHDASTQEQYADFVNTNGEIAGWLYTGLWNLNTLGGSVRSGTSPTLIRDAGTEDQWLYYVGENGEIWTWAYISPTLSNEEL
jgi:hypothetical protein